MLTEKLGEIKMVTELRKCQLLQLKITKEVVSICEKNNIEYFMVGGTMLGAIRHSGFIPWDDDVDLGMTRENFDRFVSIASEELSAEYFLQTWNSDPGYAMPFAKVRLNGTHFVESSSKNASLHDGIYVDVFPWDNVPDGRLAFNFQRYLCRFYLHLSMIKCKYTYIKNFTAMKRIAYGVLKTISFFMTKENIQEKLLYNMTKYRNVETNRATNIPGGAPYEKETLQKKWLKNLKKYDFEDTKLLGSIDYDEYLSYFFGDYMTPPPENKRREGHSVIHLDLGVYKNIGTEEK